MNDQTEPKNLVDLYLNALERIEKFPHTNKWQLIQIITKALENRLGVNLFKNDEGIE